jgi:chorismate synthase
MPVLRLLTAGESHGKACVAMLEGFPAGVFLDEQKINAELAKRQSGYGRGGRQKIEKDRVSFLTGVRRSRSFGAPITLAVYNRDERLETAPEIAEPRPGHADLAGYLKYDVGIREVLERASARETAGRVAAGALARLVLEALDIRIFAHVTRIGPAALPEDVKPTLEDILAADLPDGGGEVRCAHEPTAQAMREAIDVAAKRKDTLGGTVEVIVTGLPAGLGTHVEWDRRLDGKLAQSVMSVQAIKAVEIGLGTRVGELPGSEVHDPIHWDPDQTQQPGSSGYWRPRNGAGGLEGGMTNGAPLVVRATMKPISTLMEPLPSVSIESKEEVKAAIERSDTCAVPAASVVIESAVAFTLVEALLDKFGGDSIQELQRHFRGYLDMLRKK